MILALLGALCIGLSLGLLGSGGSILTVPVLVLLLHRPEKAAIAEALGIVGGIAAAGAVPYALHRLVQWRSVVFFGLPGMLGSYLGALLSPLVSGTLQLGIFALVMVAAAMMMLRAPASPHKNLNAENQRPHREFWKIALDGLMVGLLTGFVGVGGGFLIVPALVLLGGLPMRLAIGTSLCIIALNCLVGFYTHLQELPALGLSVHWNTIAIFLTVGVLGSFAGNMIGSRINQAKLRRWFGYFLIIMGLYILVRQGFQLAR